MNVANVRIESFREKSRDTATRIVIVRKTLIRKYNSKKVTFKTQSLKKRKRRERERERDREREREKNLFYAIRPGDFRSFNILLTHRLERINLTPDVH